MLYKQSVKKDSELVQELSDRVRDLETQVGVLKKQLFSSSLRVSKQVKL